MKDMTRASKVYLFPSRQNCNYHSVKCYCGKTCKGLHGLKMHQCNCLVVKDLVDEAFDIIEENLTGSYTRGVNMRVEFDKVL